MKLLSNKRFFRPQCSNKIWDNNGDYDHGTGQDVHLRPGVCERPLSGFKDLISIFVPQKCFKTVPGDKSRLLVSFFEIRSKTICFRFLEA